MNKIKVFFIISFFLGICLQLKPASRPILLISIPKCGTHLLMKCITTLTHKTALFPGFVTGKSLFKQLNGLDPNKFLRVHLPYSVGDARIINQFNPIAFFLYRDPRDQVVSFAHWLRHDLSSSMNQIPREQEQLITNIISNGKSVYEQLKWYFAKTIKDVYSNFLMWGNCPNLCVIRFENLIGPEGGGTRELQCAEIQKIANHLGMRLSEDEIYQIAVSLFGGTDTFRDGQIGSWNKEFTTRHKALFKTIAQDVLVDLGYEADDQW